MVIGLETLYVLYHGTPKRNVLWAWCLIPNLLWPASELQGCPGAIANVVQGGALNFWQLTFSALPGPKCNITTTHTNIVLHTPNIDDM